MNRLSFQAEAQVRIIFRNDIGDEPSGGIREGEAPAELELATTTYHCNFRLGGSLALPTWVYDV
jgi:hypothetical protein